MTLISYAVELLLITLNTILTKNIIKISKFLLVRTKTNTQSKQVL